MSLNKNSVSYIAFAIRDVKADAFNLPFFQTTRASAIRNFADLSSDPQSTIARHPEDFQLYEIGSYDSGNAYFTSLELPILLASATEFNSQQ